MKSTRNTSWTRIALAVLAGTLAVTLAACGDGGGGNDTNTGGDTGGSTGDHTGEKFGSNTGGSTGGGTTTTSPVARFLLSANSDGTVSTFLVDGATGNVTAHSYHRASAFQVTDLATTPDGKFVLIVAGNELQSLAIDAASGFLSHVATVATGTAPRELALTEDGGHAYVVDVADRTVTAFAIDTTTGTPTTIGSVACGRNPAAVAVHPSGNFVYTADRDDDTISVFPRNATSGALSAATASSVGSRPTDLTFNPAGTVAYVTHASDLDNVRVYDVDATSGALTEKQTVTAGSAPVDVSVDAAGKYLYTANAGSDNVSVFAIDATSGELAAVQTIACGDTPAAVTIGPRGDLLYTANGGSDDTTAFAVDDGTGRLTLIAHVRGRAALNAVAAANATDYGARHADYALAPDTDGIHVYEIADAAGTLSPVGTVTAGSGPVDVEVDPRGRFTYVADPADDTVTLYNFDAGTGTAAASHTVSPPLTEMHLIRAVPEPSGRFLYVLDGRDTFGIGNPAPGLSGRIFAYEINDNGTLTAIDTVDTGRNPENLVIHPAGRHLYTIDSYGDTITLFEIGAADGRLTQKQTFTPGGTGAGAGRPVAMAFHPNGRYAYVTLEDDREIVRYSINPANGYLENAQRTAVPTTDGRPRYIALHPSGELAYSTDWGGDVSTYAVDGSSFTLTWTASVNVVAGNPSWIAVDPQGGFALAAVTGGTVRFTLDGAGTLSAPVQTLDTGTGSSSVARTVTLAAFIR